MSTVTCPECDHEFIPIRNKCGEGAQYVKNWKTLPEQLGIILSLWLSVPELRNEPREKSELYHFFAIRGHFCKEDPFNARISELLGLGLISMSRNKKSHPHKTITPPKYTLDIHKATKILNDGGVLKWQ